MEANSIIPVKADYRPTGAQARNELGDIFQGLLRESTSQFDTPVAPAQFEDRSNRAEPRRDARVEPARTDIRARLDRPYRLDRPDDISNDFTILETSTSIAPRADSAADGRYQAAPVDRIDETAPAPTAESGQPSQGEASLAATASTGAAPQTSDDTLAAATGSGANAPAAGIAATPSAGALDSSLASATVKSDAATPVTNGFVPTVGQSDTTPSSPAKTTDTAQSTAASQPIAATGTTTLKATAGNGVAQVSVKTAPIHSQATATQGGGAATAAIATATSENSVEPAAPRTESGSRVAQGTGTPGAASQGQSSLGASNTQSVAANAQTVATDSRTLASQSASAAAAAGVAVTQDPATVRRTETTGGPETDPDQPGTLLRSNQVIAGRGGSPSNNSAVPSGTSAETSAGQITPGQADSSKTTNPSNQDVRASQQAQSDLPARTQIQPSASAAAGLAQGAPAQSAEQLVATRDAGSPSGRTDAVSSQGVTLTQVVAGGFTQVVSSASSATGSTGQSGPAQASPAGQISVEVQKAIGAGKDHVRVRLNPAELGQIDVSLKVRHDGTLRAIVTADRPETFDMLQRDSRGLERALNDAGLKTDSGSLSFNLRGGDSNGTNGGQGGANGSAQANPKSDRIVDAPPVDMDVPTPEVSNHALDIRV